ncbi:MAG: GNAT family N-acetyltransferase, partial [Pseudomonadota bacterium]
FLGFAGLWMPLDFPEPEISYCLMPGADRKGFATEAVSAIRDEAARRGARTLVSYIDPRNERSLALAERVGAVRDGTIVLRDVEVVVMRHDLSNPVRPLGDDLPYLEPSAMPVSIATERLLLERWKVTHFEPFAAMMADAETTRFTTGVLDRATSWRSFVAGAGSWQLRGYGTYAVLAGGEFAGFCGLFFPHEWPDVELAYSLAPKFRGQGFAREACEAVRFVAAEQGLRRLTSYIHPDNTRSIRVAEALGAKREGMISLGEENFVAFAHHLERAKAPTPA